MLSYPIAFDISTQCLASSCWCCPTYQGAVATSSDERDKVQKKTFTKWINQHLMKVRKHVNDLYEDLRDGHNLISLLEVLSGDTLPREKGRMRFHRLQNVQIALDYLKKRQVRGFWQM
uniref:Calponin-homology (CH) domain-containing protein n=1 Tax=Meleagris gallopavo TaxID=9103 RepID=A0A803XL23_MELGA